MNFIVPFKKDIKFKTSIGDITSISLEHEYNVNKGVVLGNFIVSGEYKTHELSVNTDKFSNTVPFDLVLDRNIDDESVTLEIDNFTYKTVSPDILSIEIDYLVKGLEKEEERKITFEEEPQIFEDLNFDNLISEEKDNIERNEVEEVVEDKIDNTSKNTIMNLSANNEETFITYEFHLVKEGETLETISKMYGKSESEIMEYNENIKYLPGDKVLITEDE